jgi:2-polyprenyl-3-methyl-5-hydroxy-6-metoxy-1,4-benzoquinol methylase
MTGKTRDYCGLYDNAWSQALASGREDFGDLECDTAFIEKTGLLERDHSILEFGCGIGKLCNWLFLNGYRNVTGIDISRAAVDFGKNRHPHLNLICTEAEAFDAPEASFDICLSFDFIEHLPDVSSHLGKACSLLKPGGKYLVQTPNVLTSGLYSTITSLGLSWRTSHPSLQTRRSLHGNFLQAGFSRVRFYSVSPVSEFKLGHLPPLARLIFAGVPWEWMPSFLQIGFYAAAWK